MDMTFTDKQLREIHKLGAGAIGVNLDRRSYVLRDESGHGNHGTLVNFDPQRDTVTSK